MDRGRRQLLILMAGSVAGAGGLALVDERLLSASLSGEPVPPEVLPPLDAPLASPPSSAIAAVAPSKPEPSSPPEAPRKSEPEHDEPAVASSETLRLIEPFEIGSSIGFGWAISAVLGPNDGSLVLDLAHTGGRTARVRAYRNGGKPRGLAHSEHLDLMLVTSTPGRRTPTDEYLGRAIWTLASNITSRVAPRQLALFAREEGIPL